MSFGIPTKSMKIIMNTLVEKKEIEKASVFGSRAMGNYKNGSDVDIVIYGDSITVEVVNQVSLELNEKLPLPYYFDIVHYETLEHEGLKEHIDKHSKIFYEKGTRHLTFFN
ncbi:Nucleotidyltransferase domain-containing protein [Natronincola peptidivorans]|uniref:Nucleotidyltransferase domain-containing protein n=1 Tax=Natronincola peptidivorans TaxID=426128 RepID=A0A1H9ZIQ9_9FIRM|nr:nucleotidyltransferase domain-containing protein [Natronincola peptidivorans]SES81213.1 Nucleotidyltransferase domain-containing protein [Natronincola peptidivorans]